MGLKEKRAIQAFQEGKLEELKGQINEIAGKEFNFDIAWEELAEDEMDHLYEDAWQKIYFTPVSRALTDICADNMGKEAVASGVDTIQFKNSGEYANPSGISFANKTLTIDHKPTTNLDNTQQRFEKTKEIIENSL